MPPGRRRVQRGVAHIALCVSWSFAQCSCAHDESDPATKSVPGDAFALVGARALSNSLLSLRGRHLSPRDVLFDELLAQEAKRTMPGRARAIERAVLARALLEDLGEAALERHPVTDAQLEAQRARSWLRFDRPRAVRSVSVFVPVGELADERAPRAFIETLREAARGTRSLQSLRDAFSAVDSKYEYIPVRQPPLSEDGRVVPVTSGEEVRQDLGAAYARALADLAVVGEVTEVMALDEGFVFGWVEEIVPPRVRPISQVRDALEKEIVAPYVDADSKALVAAHSSEVKWSTKDLSALLGTVWRRQ